MRYVLQPLLAVLGLLAPTLSAQVPEGWFVTSAFRHPTTNGPYLGGLALVHPRALNQFVNVQGLGPDLEGQFAAAGGDGQGASCVLYRESDGLLVVGEHADFGQTLDIHAITLNGTAVAPGGDVRHYIGTSSSGAGSVDQMAWVTDTQVLFTHRPTTSGPMAGFGLGVLDLTTGAVTPLSTSAMNGTVNAMAYDAASGVIWVGRFAPIGGGQYTSYIYRVPFAGGTAGAASLFTTLSGVVLQLAVDSAGRLFAGMGYQTPPTDLLEIDTTSGIATKLNSIQWGVNALCIEASTGNLLYAANDPVTSGGAYVGPAAGPFVQVVDVAAAIAANLPLLAVPSGMAVNSNMDTYGTATPGANQYELAFAPNPGGLPILGNAGFTLTVVSKPMPASASVLLIAPAPASVPLFGVTVLVSLASHVLVPLPAAASATVSAGIPIDPTLRLFPIYMQSLHVEPSGLATSAGIRVTIL